MALDTDWSNAKSSLGFLKHTGAKAHGGKWDKIVGDDKPFDIQPFLDMFKTTKEQFWFGGDYYAKTLPEGGNWFVWDKRLTEEFDKMYGSCFELIWSKNKHRREIIRVKWAGIFGSETQDIQTRMHPTQKPIQLLSWFLNKFSKHGENIIDFFGGSGSTMIACEQTERICHIMECEPIYIDTTLERFYKLTGDDPIRESDGVKWSELKSSLREQTD